MKCTVLHIKKLLEAFAQKEGVSLDGFGFTKMSDALNDRIDKQISPRYLGETLFDQVRKKKLSKEINVREEKIEIIAKHLGFKNFTLFKAVIDHPIDPILKECAGSYYCYVRVNSEDTVILRSPVSIYISEDGLIQWELAGPHYSYEGTIVYVDHCLFVTMKAALGKQFHHVYKIGRRGKPLVLQGIFSGVTTAFDPIGGRVLLIRQNADFSLLKERKEKGNVLAKSKLLEDRRVAQYFSKYSDNNLKPLPSRGFDLDDLGNCK